MVKTKANHLVASKVIEVATLHSPLPVIQHAYSLPFSVVYVAWAYVYFFQYEELLGSKEFSMLTLILALAANVLALLVCQWSVNAKAWLTCKEEKDPKTAKIIKIIPAAHQGAGALCPIEEMKIDGQYFFFQKKKYVYNADKKIFENLRFPSDDGKTVAELNACRGLINEAEANRALDLYGLNKFDVPIPTFIELFKEHAVAPFFVFQLFCVALWFLDDMWYYSLFTLFMLIVFESTVVLQRLKNLQEFRAMSIQPYPIFVYRKKQWMQIQTDELLPGDVCSILRSVDDCLHASGESTPQLKESISVRDATDVLFGGTKILQVTPPAAGSPIAAPDNGCIAYQGKLVRTIIYSTERITANNRESLFFIVFLLIFAIMASYYVWTEGIKNEERKKEKILLDFAHGLSLAVNNSLMALVKHYIFCTEPFRIPFAGKVDVACFDKTGTLTEENLIVDGVSGLGKDTKELIKPLDAPKQTSLVLAAAHALVQLDDGIIGDPMEKNTLESIQWSLGKDEFVRPKKADSVELKIMRAPETLRSMYKDLPADYDDVYKYWARRGSRVLALGYRVATEMKASQIREVSRDAVESNLVFAGFLIFFCPLKPDSADAIQMLNNSSHRCVMITGDNALTACHVAKEVGIVSKPVLILDIKDPRLAKFELCVTGRALFAALLPRIWVYARVSPSQKEDILNALKNAGYHTLMCGDGTNDEEIEKYNKLQMERRKIEFQKKQNEAREKLGWSPAVAPGQKSLTGATAEEIKKDPKAEFEKQMEMLNNMLGEMEDMEAPTIKFGDASVAAPFTSKLGTVMSCHSVAMVQMYKILALNCLISAYSMSVMYLAGIKTGDCHLRSSDCRKRDLKQLACHVASLIYIRAQAIEYSEELDEIRLDAEFQPNLLNSAVYLVSLIMQISTFAINYQGEPFRESLFKNKSLYNSLLIVTGIAVLAASEISPELNSTMQLVPFPDDFRYKLMATMAFDFGGAWVVEVICNYLFSDNRAKAELF
ncbi:hypothetical protein BCR33DRAFT_754574 [Rhizoclosmatium globosum]|uniref:P5A-ATPase transmembrane helical hairpin domain-containing protein n=1 Tax=Rhizoclosmatium globosum TaxID=329046 RepID=A0A1Y2BVL8_9FUNG|nr:hypothetical protein BCR33DRAFT_754574 [Rhizoclosmatium globosum]|eukprot:ORY38145.1 hypothetical protein BCR33DRAFT_754574 [Rhizoclosmatium globosum]